MATKKDEEMIQPAALQPEEVKPAAIDVDSVLGAGSTAQGTAIPKADLQGLYKTANQYSDIANQKIDEFVAGGNKFSYDFNADPVFQSLKAQYTEQANNAAKNASALAALRTGGYGNSYGAAASSQAYNESINDLYDNVPTLEQNAYGRYQDTRNEQLQVVNLALQQAADANNRYETARANELSVATMLAEQGDYSALGEILGMDASKLQNDYDLQREVDLALKTGNLAGLQAMGYDTTYLAKLLNFDFEQAEWQRGLQEKQLGLSAVTSALSAAVTKAGQTGDWSQVTNLINQMKSYITEGGGGNADVIDALDSLASKIGTYSVAGSGGGGSGSGSGGGSRKGSGGSYGSGSGGGDYKPAEETAKQPTQTYGISYSDAVRTLHGAGDYTHIPMTGTEWAKHKGTGVGETKNFDTYEAYLRAYVDYYT